jgi:hypothetical protein
MTSSAFWRRNQPAAAQQFQCQDISLSALQQNNRISLFEELSQGLLAGE